MQQKSKKRQIEQINEQKRIKKEIKQILNEVILKLNLYYQLLIIIQIEENKTKFIFLYQLRRTPLYLLLLLLIAHMSISITHNSDSLKKTNFQQRQTYYSKTQANFFKAYARQIQFVNRLNTLMTGIQKRKLLKVTEQTKTCNKAFRKYLNERRIVHIKIQDVIAFEEAYQKNNTNSGQKLASNSKIDELKRSLLPSVSLEQKKRQHRTSNYGGLGKGFAIRQSKQDSISGMQRQMVKKGFMTLLQKLQNLKKDEFTNETRYLQGVLMRQCQKLKEYYLGSDDDSWKGPRKSYNGNKMSVVQQIQKQQKCNGLYPIIMKNIREETMAVQRAERVYEELVRG